MEVLGFTSEPADHLRPGFTSDTSNPKLQLLQERQSCKMSKELQNVVAQISLRLDVRPAGSFRFQSVAYPGDVDLYEYLVVEGEDADTALGKLSEMLMLMAHG